MSTVRSGTLVLAKIKRLSCLHSRTAINHLSTNADYKPIKSVLVANRGNAIYFQLSYLLTVLSQLRPWGIIFFSSKGHCMQINVRVLLECGYYLRKYGICTDAGSPCWTSQKIFGRSVNPIPPPPPNFFHLPASLCLD